MNDCSVGLNTKRLNQSGQNIEIGQSDQSRRDNTANRAFSVYQTEAQIQAQKDAKPKCWQSHLSGSVAAGTGSLTGGFSSLGGMSSAEKKAAGKQG